MKNKAIYSPTFVKVVKKSKLWVLWKFWFPGAEWKRVVVAFGRNIYSPENTIPADLMAHETHHLFQQRFSYIYALWWHLKYRLSSRFRYSQEVECYGRQLQYVRNNAKGNRYQNRPIWQWREAMAKLLSSKMYGSIATFDEASEAIDRASQ